MLEKLDQLEEKYEAISKQMQDPDVVQNQSEYQRLAKEHSQLHQIVMEYRDFRKIKSNIRDNRDLLKEDDEEIKALAKAELPELEAALEEKEQELKFLLLPKDPNDEKNIIIEIRAGTGGEEAGLFAADLFRMYQRYADEKGWRVEVMSVHETGNGGFKEIIALVSGDSVYSHLKYESGVHRVQRVPQTESQGRVHTSAVTVAVMPEAEDFDVEIKDGDLEIDVFRSSGPGGQSVNTTDSAVRVTHVPSGLVVVCMDERSQLKNKAKAMKVLKSRLYALEEEKRLAEERDVRKSMVGSGDRSEKIRTYNYPQNRMTDHRIGLTLKKLDQVVEGDLEEVVTALRTHYQTEALKAGGG